MTPTVDAPTEAKPSWQRWTRVALVASLAVNLGIAGACASAYWRLRREAPFAAVSVNLPGNLLGFTSTLTPERRSAIMRQTGDQRRSLRPLRAEVQAARLAARTVFLADPFDREAFAKAQAQVLDAEFRARKETQAMFIEIAGALSREERQAFARWQPEGPRAGREPGGRGKRQDFGRNSDVAPGLPENQDRTDPVDPAGKAR